MWGRVCLTSCPMPHGSIESPTAPTTDWLVTQHALGRLPRAASVLAEAYLELNPQKRAVAARIEDVGGYLLETAEPVSLGSNMDDAALVEQALPDGPEHDGVIPPSLAENVGPPPRPPQVAKEIQKEEPKEDGKGVWNFSTFAGLGMLFIAFTFLLQLIGFPIGQGLANFAQDAIVALPIIGGILVTLVGFGFCCY